MYALNKCKRLPRFVIILPDVDIIDDVKEIHVDNVRDAEDCVEAVAIWLVKQAKIAISCKRLELMERKPGAVYSTDPKIIFVRALRRHFLKSPSHRLEYVCHYMHMFNTALNNAVAEANLNIMTVISCASLDHFANRSIQLTDKGKESFWREIDDLLKRFDDKQVKLLPNQIKSSSSKHYN